MCRFFVGEVNVGVFGGCRNFVECVVWWLMWVVLVVCVGGSVVL